LRAGLRYIRTSISALKTAVFSCLTNALAPPPIALKRAVQELKWIGPSSRLHSKNFFVWWYGFFVTDVTSEVVLRSLWFMLPGLGHNR